MQQLGVGIRIFGLALMWGSVGFFWANQAAASANIPLHHWAYESIERLTALGIIDQAMVVTKPYSRKEAARYVARALERVRKDKVVADGREVLAEPLLDRLMQEFRPELMDLDAVARAPGASARGFRYGGHIQTEVDGFFVGGGQTVRFRENRGGEYYVNGAIDQTDIRGWFEIGDWLSVNLQPKFISNEHVLGIGATNNNKNFYLREGSIKISHFNVALEIGRGTQWWGPGYHGSLLLTDHAFPLDMIKLGSDQAFRIPWLEGLGQWKVNSFLTRLEKNRDFPRAQVFGLRISYMPTDWLELGLARLTQFDGRGNDGKDQWFPAILVNTYFSDTNRKTKIAGGQPQPGPSAVNEQAMFDFRASIPSVPYLIPFPGGLQFYGEVGLEDPPNGLGLVVGTYLPQVFKGDTLDLRLEYANTDIRRELNGVSAQWYNNGFYTSGMRYRGFPLGHHMGTDGTDFLIRTTRYLTDNLQIGANFNLQERAKGLPVHERKREAAVDLTWWVSRQTEFKVGYTFQRLQNPGQITSIQPFVETFAQGVTADNNFLWTSLTLKF